MDDPIILIEAATTLVKAVIALISLWLLLRTSAKKQKQITDLNVRISPDVMQPLGSEGAVGYRSLCF